MTRKPSRPEPPVTKKAKFVIPAETHDQRTSGSDAYGHEQDDEDDDEDQWVSSGVVTPDDREPEQDAHDQPPPAAVLGPPPGLKILPLTDPQHDTTLQQPPLTPRLQWQQQQFQHQPQYPQYQEAQSRVSTSPEVRTGPSSVPTYDSSAAIQHHVQNINESDLMRPGAGLKTAPSSRPPSIRAKRPPTRPPSIHGGPPHLLRTSSFTPSLNTMAPPLMTTSIASAQITSANADEADEDETEYERSRTPPTQRNASPPGSRRRNQAGRDAWAGIAPRRDSPPGSPVSSRHHHSAFLPPSHGQLRPSMLRTNTSSSVASTVPAQRSGAEGGATPTQYNQNDSFGSSSKVGLEPRSRKPSTFSAASEVVAGIFNAATGRTLNQTPSPTSSNHSPHLRHSAALSSLHAIPKRRDTPPPTLTSHFPPESQQQYPAQVNGGSMGMFALLPAPYMAAHMAVRTYESPLQDAFARVVLVRPRKASNSTGGSGRG